MNLPQIMQESLLQGGFARRTGWGNPASTNRVAITSGVLTQYTPGTSTSGGGYTLTNADIVASDWIGEA